ncbi:hypothetical protein J8I26_12915 [Herbaspirillum sp. LeCh32-8]|uniref:hypothetical protein n=1 Tax=Herbaspirillum sp. LeCh32-8 TaxID=2821356 RepID=UPI001AE41A75|nr:hypothetical protein [Herbaspirillum sp. LeCh32-8]MBP0599016.1 hypothetical protein [Herbaspirillum sp. LeCh32-8]
MNGTWSWPLLLASLTLGGLAAGIFGDGLWDWLCWAGLVAPVWVVARKLRLHWKLRARPDA